MGIKSFETPKVSPKSLTDKPSLHVSDYMRTNVQVFYPEQSLNEVIEILIAKKISGGPVVNQKNELVGIISEGDCLKQISDTRYHNMPETRNTVGDYMTKDVKTLDGSTNIFDAIGNFLSEKKRRFPITKNGKLIGQISQRELLNAVTKIEQQFYQ